MDKSSQLYLLLTSLFLLQLLIDYSSANLDINTDRSSLTAFKSRISFDPHNILTKNWSSESSVCSWIGVTCDSRNHRVTQLNVSNMGLVGTIPPEIGNLSSLVSLDMSYNSFYGPIHPSIFNLSILEYMCFNFNNLSGRLPLDMCKQNLDRLVFFRISYNEFSGKIPTTLDQCSKLVYLAMFNNKFDGFVPREIGNLTKLQILNLGGNKLTGRIPSIFENQHELIGLGLSSNNFSGQIPSSICNLRSLQILNLTDNHLEGSIPDCLGNLSTSLVILHLNENKLSDIIPSTFKTGCSLQSINLNGNRLKGTLPQTLANCQGLFGIDLGNNEIRDAFPFWMETLPHLRILVLRSNKFNGTMLVDSNSNTEQSFPKLQVLDVSKNMFVGSLPDRYINKFRGMIDAKENQTDDEAYLFLTFIEMKLTLKGLDQLLNRLLDTFTTLDLSSNRFSGNIPSSIGNLNSLRYLNLSHNTLTGHIPLSLGHMSLLESLDLSSNKLGGEIPDELSRLTFLGKLNLSMNNLEGQIPQSTQLSTFGNEAYVGNEGLCGFPLTKEYKRGDGKPSPPYVEVKSDREIKWDYVFAAAGYVVGLGIFSWLLLFCRCFRYNYFEKVDNVFETILECFQLRKKRERRRRDARNQVTRQ